MNQFKNRLATHLIVAQEDENIQDLRILVDEPSHKLVNKIYKTYISADNFSKFHAFIIDLDRLLARFGGKALNSVKNQNAPLPQNPDYLNSDEL